MRAPTTVTSDGAPGLIAAIKTCFPPSVRIRCWFHRLANLRAKLPDETAGEVLAHVYAVRDASDAQFLHALEVLVAGYLAGAAPNRA